MTTWVASFKLKHGVNTITYHYIINQNNSNISKEQAKRTEMRWHEASASPSCSFAKVRQENGQSGTLCFQETAMPRAKREHDQMMPQRFHCFFRSTATNHTQARQQARRDTIMMRYCIQNLGSSCEWRIHVSCMMEKVVPHSRRWRHIVKSTLTLMLPHRCRCLRTRQHTMTCWTQQFQKYPIDSDLPPGFCNISDG